MRKTSYAVGICFLNRTTTNNITNTTGTNLLLSVCCNASCWYPTLYIISLSRLSVRLSLFVLIKLPLFKVDKWLLLLSILSDNYGKFWHWTLLLTLSFHETPSIICNILVYALFSQAQGIVHTFWPYSRADSQAGMNYLISRFWRSLDFQTFFSI